MDSIVDKVYDDMRIRILQGEFGVNDVFVEQAVAQEYNVSRGSAREALQKLCQTRFLIKHPRKGYFIYNFSDQELRDITYARFHVEMAGILLVVENRTDDEIRSLLNLLDDKEQNYLPDQTANYQFHMALAELSGNKAICDLLGTLLDITSRGSVVDSTAKWNPNHESLVEALLSRNLKAIRKALREDLEIRSASNSLRT